MKTDIVSHKAKPPRAIAVIEAWCTGCGGAPVCAVYCNRRALNLVRDKDVYPFMTMTVDSTRCIGCGACVSGGRQGIMLSGCPWDAIRLEKNPEKDRLAQ